MPLLSFEITQLLGSGFKNEMYVMTYSIFIYKNDLLLQIQTKSFRSYRPFNIRTTDILVGGSYRD